MRYLIALALALSVVIASVATAQTTEDTLSYTEFQPPYQEAKSDIRRIKENRCRSVRAWPYASSIAETGRRWWLAHARHRRSVVKTLPSKCWTQRMWTWFNTSGAECVKAHEGSWWSNTGNSYYGGFQADLSFQSAYGAEYLARWGTANNWAPIYQIHMAYRGWSARGWSPWPNTARMCGLL